MLNVVYFFSTNALYTLKYIHDSSMYLYSFSHALLTFPSFPPSHLSHSHSLSSLWKELDIFQQELDIFGESNPSSDIIVTGEVDIVTNIWKIDFFFTKTWWVIYSRRSIISSCIHDRHMQQQWGFYNRGLIRGASVYHERLSLWWGVYHRHLTIFLKNFNFVPNCTFLFSFG